MAYTTKALVEGVISEKTLEQLTDDKRQGTFNLANFEACAEWADTIIDAKLGVRYTVPFDAPHPDLIVAIATDLTVYKLYKRRLDLETPEGLRSLYTDSIKLLEGIADGSVLIGVDIITVAGFAITAKNVRTKLFGPSVLRQMP